MESNNTKDKKNSRDSGNFDGVTASKIKFPLYIYPETMKTVNSLYKADCCPTKTEFMEKAIRFYCAHLMQNKPELIEYLAPQVGTIVDGIIKGTEQRLSRAISDEKYSLEKAILLLDKGYYYEDIKPYAAYLYAKILLDNNDFHDAEKAVQLLKETADKNNWCSYLLGKLYLFGSYDIERNKAEAVKWLSMSAESGNEYAQHLLENADNYNSAMLTSTVVGLMINLGRIIEEDNRRSRKNISRADRKLMHIIQKKKENLGIKSTGIDMKYDY